MKPVLFASLLLFVVHEKLKKLGLRFNWVVSDQNESLAILAFLIGAVDQTLAFSPTEADARKKLRRVMDLPAFDLGFVQFFLCIWLIAFLSGSFVLCSNRHLCNLKDPKKIMLTVSSILEKLEAKHGKALYDLRRQSKMKSINTLFLEVKGHLAGSAAQKVTNENLPNSPSVPRPVVPPVCLCAVLSLA